MTEFRRLKMRIGEAEFEADVPESEVQPMYHQFLSMLERRNQASVALFDAGAKAVARDRAIVAIDRAGSSVEMRGEAPNRALLARVFDLHESGAVTLKVLPTGPDPNTHAMLLLLYGYYRLKNEESVLVTQLFRAAEQSGLPLRRPVSRYVRNSRFVVRGGSRKGSHYSLSGQGLVVAEEITAKLIS
jgi:hypothetical protein